jgi:hypothetical protein
MIPCYRCRKEVPFRAALLTQDLAAKPLAFCSDVCHGLWSHELFAPASQELPATQRNPDQWPLRPNVSVRSPGFRNPARNLQSRSNGA